MNVPRYHFLAAARFSSHEYSCLGRASTVDGIPNGLDLRATPHQETEQARITPFWPGLLLRIVRGVQLGAGLCQQLREINQLRGGGQHPKDGVLHHRRQRPGGSVDVAKHCQRRSGKAPLQLGDRRLEARPPVHIPHHHHGGPGRRLVKVQRGLRKGGPVVQRVQKGTEPAAPVVLGVHDQHMTEGSFAFRRVRFTLFLRHHRHP